MKLYEYNAKKLFKMEGIPIPEGYVAKNPDEVYEASKKINAPVALKAQVLVGGRGKSGGIKFASSPKNAYDLSKSLFNTKIKGEKVKKILIEEKIDIKEELYISVIIDRAAKKPLIMGSVHGGVDVEEKVRENSIVKYHVNPLDKFMPYEGREIARKMGLESNLIPKVGNIIWKTYKLFKKYDAKLVEINPLAITPDNKVIALDAKIDLDYDGVYRHPEIQNLEEYKEREFAFTKLDGDIAVIGNGAGLTLAAMDIISLYGGKPATFLDIGGGASSEVIEKALNFVSSLSNVKVIFVNILGGITRADEVAKGIVKASNELDRDIPIVIRLTGTNQRKGHEILKNAGIPFETSLEKAAKKAVEISNSFK
ncbi:succinyl-CoA synthetase (ADP-forming) beta subunit [Methanothermus fervidus DSM 2088]|uniref:Succinate--CoA ligase [ADP-forming] subunit beta n=1 Tax=Methanothermus fervidus (strain ATCC 43054 / DSM 2088 / JCM 10308 / V24 S) TaxID=523846 RepID=E3GWM2_METFV|nr:ADP-forming succinate--CoA ligase subunit beta [Methanothermus fervidus]ADP76836.1 succinyl-CoA synthetase (ADP-forming) beta subunit [Methanothermus fervidus DSM 2088]